MRAADCAEIAAVFNDRSPTDVLALSVLLSTFTMTWAIDGVPAAIFGAAPISLLDGTGAPWMLATETVFRRPGSLVREGRRYVARMLGLYPHLVNYVDARNERSVRWLAHIGFTIHPARPFGRQGEPFHKFELKV